VKERKMNTFFEKMNYEKVTNKNNTFFSFFLASSLALLDL